MTVIEKLADVGFGIVLYMADDKREQKLANNESLQPQARQNVLLEHGYLMGKFGRDKTSAIVENGVELPSDIRGLVYAEKDNWKVDVAKDLKEAGYDIDFNKLFKVHLEKREKNATAIKETNIQIKCSNS